MALRPNPDPRLWWGAVSDKVLVRGKVRYLLFYDVDLLPTERVSMPGLGLRFRIFPTRNGFHAIGLRRASAAGKARWFAAWAWCYPRGDYRLQNLNWLAPHSEEEMRFILSVAGEGVPLQCSFYRDKGVLEN